MWPRADDGDDANEFLGLFLLREEGTRLPEDREEPELVGVVGGRRREGVEVRCDEVGSRALGAPRGEAGGDAVIVLEIPHSVLEGLWILSVCEDTGVGRVELVRDTLAATGHATHRGNWLPVFLLQRQEVSFIYSRNTQG